MHTLNCATALHASVAAVRGGRRTEGESVEGILQSHNIASFFEWWVYESQNSAPNFLHVFVIGPGVLYY